ncbi:hypothetical protein B5S28_g1679 [[Candida] boidinii]|nr:hypothetical protein B5S28_g1679 [[Candida] boidinii]OWB61995.1 hypothetical protein B5S29_g2905 [[Candida] boidinii]OWB72970.1 hypothetical protein B5S31_g2699 [[Candida] boidinii]OWB78769.1 hypothetical protein B5S32_g2971 [[Candida] boidinii]GME95491.1 unnamed protein product [[Candida] boidinii]
MLVLAIGDLHIPERSVDLPLKFKKLLQPSGKIDQVLCLGNVTQSQSTIEFLKSISLDFQIVKGEFDRDFNLPLSLVFNYDKLKIGILNGFSIIPQNDPLSLLTQARLMDVDILISGGTHKLEAYVLDGKFFINPGSATGVYSTNPLDDEDLNLFNSLINEKKLDLLNKSKNSENEIIGNDNNENDNITDKNKDKETSDINDKSEETSDKNKESEVDKSNDVISKEISTEESNKETTKEDKDVNDTKEIKDNEDEDEIDDDLMEEVEPYISSIPSFCLLDIQGSVCTLYLYTLIDGEVKVDKVTYRKEEK